MDKQHILIEWQKVQAFILELNGKKRSDVNAVLFLIGLQEVGHGIRSYSKEQKQDLIHVGTCSVLQHGGYYKLSHRDDDNWPHFTLEKKPPHGKIGEQELFLKNEIITYFKLEELIA